AAHAGPGRSRCAGAPRQCTGHSRPSLRAPGRPSVSFPRVLPRVAAREGRAARILASIYRLDISRRPPALPRGRAQNRGAKVLELAILGLLKEQPLHGYELKKRLGDTLGS